MAETQFKRLALVLPSGPFFERVFSEVSSLGESLGAICTRAPSEFSPPSQLGQSCGEIEKADLAIIDISGRNPNTLYLAGFAHGIGKRVLFLSQHGEDLPFDRARHDFVIYHANLDLLEKALDAFLRRGATGTQTSPEPRAATEVDAKARFQTIFGDIMAEFGAEHSGEVRLENDKTFVLIEQDLELALVQALARRARELGLRIKLL